MPAILDTIRTALKRPKPTTEQISGALDVARRADAEARAAVETAAGVVAAGFMDNAVKRQADRDALAKAREEAEDAALILAEAERRHAAAVDGEAEAARAAAYAAAKAKTDAAALALAKSYPTLARGLLAMLRELAEAQAAAAAANLDLPAGAAPLADPEMVARGVAGIPREVISDTEVVAWSRLDWPHPVDPAFASKIYPVGDGGWGKMPGDVEACYRRRRFRRVEFRDAVGGELPAPLAASLYLPALSGDAALWGNHVAFRPEVDLISNFGTADHEAVLSRVAVIEAAAVVRPVKAERPAKVEWTVLADVGRCRSPSRARPRRPRAPGAVRSSAPVPSVDPAPAPAHAADPQPQEKTTMPNAAQPDRVTAIRAAADHARAMASTVPADYADKAIASGKTLDAVKAELFDLTTSSDRARSKANMKGLVAGMKGAKAEPATASAGVSRSSMLAEIKRAGMKPRAA